MVIVFSPVMTASLSQIYTSSSTTFTLTGYGTSWNSGANTPTFTLSGVSGASVTSQTITGIGSASITISTGSTGGLLTISESSTPTSCVVSVGSVLPMTTTGIYYPNLGWDLYGSGTGIQSSNPGSYWKTKITTPNFGDIHAYVDVSPMTGASLAAGNYPTIWYEINGNALTTLQLTSTTTDIPIQVAVSAGTYEIRVGIVGMVGSVDHWGNGSTVGANTVRFTRISTPYNSTIATPTGPYALQPKTLLAYGDSITSGHNDSATTTDDATLSYIWWLAYALHAEVAFHAYIGIGYVTAAQDTTTPLVWSSNSGTSSQNSWNWYNSLDSMLSGGVFPSQPDYITVMMGTNDRTANQTTVQADVSGLLASLHAVSPNSRIFQIVPFGISTLGSQPYCQAALTAGTLNQTNAVLIDAQASSTWLGQMMFYVGQLMADTLHPTYAGHGFLSNVWGAMINQVIKAGGGNSINGSLNGG